MTRPGDKLTMAPAAVLQAMFRAARPACHTVIARTAAAMAHMEVLPRKERLQAGGAMRTTLQSAIRVTGDGGAEPRG
ncbi:MAG: hypothetical protein K8J09_12735 [Planctomycetes bacterium]|nr:hypothetical protein [Planctomycetota bacterium]